MYMIEMMREFLFHPGRFFERAAAEKNLNQATFIFLGISFLGIAGQTIMPMEYSSTPAPRSVGQLVPSFLTDFFLGIFIFVVFMTLLHLLAKLCGGKGDSKAFACCALLLSLTGVIAYPVSFLAAIFVKPHMMTGIDVMLPAIVLSVFGIVSGIWTLVLTVIALRKSHGLSKGKAVLVLVLYTVCGFGVALALMGLLMAGRM